MTDLPTQMRRSSREPEQLRLGLEAWLGARRSGAEVTGIQTTSATGMSSDTLLFEAEWTDDDGPRRERLVARLAPAVADIPVFPTYDLTRQFRLIRRVGEQSDVPVPTTFWNEPDPTVIGTPFFVMGRVDGDVPPDLLPYNFGDSWLFDAAPEQQRTLQDSTVDILARLHDVPPPDFLEFDELGDTRCAGTSPTRPPGTSSSPATPSARR